MKLVLFAFLVWPYSTKAENYFNLIDAKTNNVIGKLPNFIDYTSIKATSARLNIEAVFDYRVASVRMTFDKPRTSICRTLVPFRVFPFTGAKIPLSPFSGQTPAEIMFIGNSTVKATPYSKPFCLGRSGTPLQQSFVVAGCAQYGFIIDVSTDTVVGEIPDVNVTVESVPCQVNLEVNSTCGFPISNIESVLTDRKTGVVLARNKDEKPGYYLFGDERTDFGSIPAGEYTIVDSVNGIEHYTVYFTVMKDCASN